LRIINPVGGGAADVVGNIQGVIGVTLARDGEDAGMVRRKSIGNPGLNGYNVKAGGLGESGERDSKGGGRERDESQTG
jgi:hypothetical protein